MARYTAAQEHMRYPLHFTLIIMACRAVEGFPLIVQPAIQI